MAIARAGLGAGPSVAAGFAGVGFGVLSGSASILGFFLPDVFFFPDLVLVPVFFFLLLVVAEELFDFADGVGRRFPRRSSSSLDFDLVVPAGDFFGFGVGESSLSPDLDFAVVFSGAGVGLFFFFGEADGDARWIGRGDSLGVSSSSARLCHSGAISAKIARAVAMQRR